MHRKINQKDARRAAWRVSHFTRRGPEPGAGEKAVGGLRDDDGWSAPLASLTPGPEPVPQDRHDTRLHGHFERDVYGALDLGTNNCRLLIARPSRRGFRVVDSFSRIIRLGEGVAQSGVLSQTAMQRTIDALGVCAGKLQREIGRAHV